MRSLPLSLAITLALASSAASGAADETLRLPANGTPNVPTNAHLWIGDGRILDQATLRDADGAAVALERIPESTPLRFRPTAELAPQKSYTLTLRFANVAIEETLTFTTGAGAEIHPPPPYMLKTSVSKFISSNGKQWGCEPGVFYLGDVRTAPSPAAVLYQLERSLDGTTFEIAESSANPWFETRYHLAWYRIRPISISNLAPADSELQTLQLSVPESKLPPCDPDAEGYDDEAGCSAAASNDTSGLLLLGLGLLLVRRRAMRPHGTRARP